MAKAGRPKAYSAAEEKRIADLATSGLTADEIVKRLRAGGSTLSRATVARLMRSARLGTSGSMALQKVDPQSDALGAIKALVPRLIKVVDEAIADGEIGPINSVARTLSTLTTQLARLEPPPPPDLNDHPDYIAAAARGREFLKGYIEKARLGK